MRFWALDLAQSSVFQFRPTCKVAGLRAVLLSGLSATALLSMIGCGNGLATSTASQPTPDVPTASALGPQLGYVWMSADQTLRPILGIAGASQVGQSVVSAGTYVNAAASATASLAVLQAADGSFDLMTLPSGSSVSLGLSLPAGARLRLSPSANAAVAFTPGASSASLITGLPATPKLQTVAASSAIADATVSDLGTVAIESTRSLSVIALNSGPVTVATLGAPGGLSFAPSSAASHDDLLFADSAANTLTLIRSSTSSPASQSISVSGLLQSPSAVGVSASGRWAVVANTGSKTAVRIDLSTLAAVSVACSCQPTVVDPLADDGAFRLTSLSTGPNWVVKAASSTPGMVFIPALPALPVTAALASSRL